MIEFLKHALGLCGESHPNLITMLLGVPTFGVLTYKFKVWTKIQKNKQR